MSAPIIPDAQMPGRFLQTSAAAIVLATCLPVAAFAISTTLAALAVLSVRASALSLDFWVSVLVESWSSGKKKQSPAPPPRAVPLPTLEFRPSAQHSRKNSFVDSASLKRLSYRSDSNVSLSGTPVNRDFEGIGGWRSSQADDDQHSLMMNMNSRLERTRSSSKHHRRSYTALNSPELLSMPLRTPKARPHTSGSASPQSYFTLPTSRSMVSLQTKRSSGIGMEQWEHGKNERTRSPSGEKNDEQ